MRKNQASIVRTHFIGAGLPRRLNGETFISTVRIATLFGHRWAAWNLKSPLGIWYSKIHGQSQPRLNILNIEPTTAMLSYKFKGRLKAFWSSLYSRCRGASRIPIQRWTRWRRRHRSSASPWSPPCRRRGKRWSRQICMCRSPLVV